MAPLPPPLTARLVSHSLIKETMKRTHQDILVRTVISSNKLLPHLVTFMGQGNHMAHAAGSRSTPANLLLLCLTLIILKDCGVPNSKVFHHSYIPNACNSLSMTKLRSFLPLLFPFLSLLTLVLSLCYLVLPLPASFWDSLVRRISLWDLLPSLMYFSTSLLCLFSVLVTELHNICCL